MTIYSRSLAPMTIHPEADYDATTDTWVFPDGYHITAQYWENLDSTDRKEINRNHGQYRKSSQASHRYTPHPANPTNQGAGLGASYTVTWNSHAPTNKGASSQLAWAMTLAQAARRPAIKWPPLQDIPQGPLVVGELQGWRCWRAKNRVLLSIATDYSWTPGGTERGDPETHGIYSWHNLIDALDYMRETSNHSHFTRSHEPDYWALGRISIWGQIVYHELGSRAEFAKILAIDFTTQRDELESLREFYKLTKRQPSSL